VSAVRFKIVGSCGQATSAGYAPLQYKQGAYTLQVLELSEATAHPKCI
jgi:hypothetical protein